MLLSLTEFINSFVKTSEVTYTTLKLLFFLKTSFPIACIKCVFPRPTPPYKNNGLYAVAGASATASAAACANLLLSPTTNVSKE